MIGPLAFLLNVCSPSSNQKPSSVLKEMETVFVDLKQAIYVLTI